MADEKKRPVQSFGPYPSDRGTSQELAIWENSLEVNGKTVKTFNVTFSRSYRDQQGNWCKNTNYRPHDLWVLIGLLQKAQSWLLDHKNGSSEE